MTQRSSWLITAILAPALALGADPVLPRELEGVGVEEKLGAQVDLSLEFMATDGYTKPLSKYFGQGRPVILNLVYYTCPMLCNLVLNGQVSVMREMPWTPGKEYDIVTISIDPTETWNLALDKRAVLLSSFDRPAPGWHFFTDHNGNVKKLAEQVGWRYKFDPRGQQYAHASAIVVLTPEGKVSRYLYGIKYKQRDVRLALAEASESKVGMSFERVLLMCFHYDPSAGSYVMTATWIMRLGGALTALAIAWFIRRQFAGERERKSGIGGPAVQNG